MIGELQMMFDPHIKIAPRFRRSIRIDSDIGDSRALEGYIFPHSSLVVLKSLARHVSEHGQGAFTWTGPYGCGKSSLAVALSALLDGTAAHRMSAKSVVDPETAELIWTALPPRRSGWKVLPVVGRRGTPESVIGDAIEKSGLLGGKHPILWTQNLILTTLETIATRYTSGGGLFVFIDEMGKILESATRDGSDIYLFQQLAELAARSDRRLVIVGILHQAFEEYARRLTNLGRDEWAKIQGRFVDLAFNVSADEQIDLLSRAVNSKNRSTTNTELVTKVAKLIQRRTSPNLPTMLERCWPLHPIVACLLVSISHRRFAQNQRSIFAFLRSAEPFGFQDFVHNGDSENLYDLDRLWDYLQTNLEPSIMASPDGHRWALAVESLDRCETIGQRRHLQLLKAIAILHLFKGRSGLVASTGFLRLALPRRYREGIDSTLRDLSTWSLIVFRKFTQTYALFEGSDFDIEEAISERSRDVDDIDFDRLSDLVGLRPIVAKRHYHETGALRWFDLKLAHSGAIKTLISKFQPRNSEIGVFVLVIPAYRESHQALMENIESLVRPNAQWDIVMGVSTHSMSIMRLGIELSALDDVRRNNLMMRGDRVARREVRLRMADLMAQIDRTIKRAFQNAIWYGGKLKTKATSLFDLNGLASNIADIRFFQSPKIANALLGRIRPSSTAVAARNTLLRRMVSFQGHQRLGITGFPPERGLFESLLNKTMLYRQRNGVWAFCTPKLPNQDPCNLWHMWNSADRYLSSNSHRTVAISEIYQLWRDPAIGLKDGLLPVLGVAYILSKWHTLAFYRRAVFQSMLTDLDVDYLSKNPELIEVRWMRISEHHRTILQGMSDIVVDLGNSTDSDLSSPLEIARGLVAIYDGLSPWVWRTQRLSSTTKQVRQILRKAKDPSMLLFDDLPSLVETSGTKCTVCDIVRDALNEMQGAFPAILFRLRELLLTELQVPNSSPAMLGELQSRAKNLRNLSGNHRCESFVIRLCQFKGTRDDIEGLATMSINKPVRNWIDMDIDRAAIELAKLAREFVSLEALAHVKGRRDKQYATAIVYGLGGQPITVHDEFHIFDHDRPNVNQVVARLNEALDGVRTIGRNVVLAALAEVSVEYLRGADDLLPEELPDHTDHGALE